MSITASFDLGELVDLKAALNKAASGKTVLAISEAQAQIAINLIRDGFDDETDPYGDKWKDKQRPNRYKNLSGKSSLLRNSWHAAKVGTGGWTVKAGVDYAAYHQSPGKYRKITRRGTSRPQGTRKRRRAKVQLVGVGQNGRSDPNLMRPQRKMIPDVGLPTNWDEAFREVAEIQLRNTFGGGGGGGSSSASANRFKLAAGRSPITAKIAGAKRRLNIISLLRKVINSTDNS